MTDGKQIPLIFRFIETPAEAVRCTASEKLVLIVILSNLPLVPPVEGAIVWPSQKSLAARTGLTDRSVRRSIKHLCEIGLLALDHNSGRGKSYAIDISRIESLIAAAPCGR